MQTKFIGVYKDGLNNFSVSLLIGLNIVWRFLSLTNAISRVGRIYTAVNLVSSRW